MAFLRRQLQGWAGSLALSLGLSAIVLLDFNPFWFPPSPKFWAEELRDARGLAARIRQQAEAPEPSPGKHLWGLLNSRNQGRLQDPPAGGAEADIPWQVTTALNELLPNPNLWDEESWKGINIGEAARAGVQRGTEKLLEVDLVLLNRLLLEAAYPRAFLKQAVPAWKRDRFLDDLELKTLDLWFRLRGPRTPHPDVVLVAADEKSIGRIGRWPWTRRVHAALVRRLLRAGAKCIAFDILFPEPEAPKERARLRAIRDKLTQAQDSPEVRTAIEAIEREIRELEADKDLLKAIEESEGKVLLAFQMVFRRDIETGAVEDPHTTDADWQLLYSNAGYTPVVDRELSRFGAYLAFGLRPQEAAGSVFALRDMDDACGGMWYANTNPDVDGIVRQEPLFIQNGVSHTHMLPLGIAVARAVGEVKAQDIRMDGPGTLVLGSWRIPIAPRTHGSTLLDFCGPAGTFPTLSYVDVMNGEVADDVFKGKIVLIGVSDRGVKDLAPTPFSNMLPGTEKQATVVDNILSGRFIRPQDTYGWPYALELLAPGLLFGLILLRARIGVAVVLFLASLATLWSYSYHAFSTSGRWIPVVVPSLSIFFAFLGSVLRRLVTEERSKKVMRTLFQNYVSASVVNEIMKDPEKVSLGGARVEATLFFCDVKDFTTISESLDCVTLVALMNEFFTEASRIVLFREGYLDKYIGDCVMAIFGVPVKLSDHPLRACQTALEIQEMTKTLRESLKARGLPEIHCRIGLASGEVVVGNMGSEQRMNYTAMGDTVNLASRLEGINKNFGTKIICSEGTYRAVKDCLTLRELDQVHVKGKKEPVAVFEVIGTKGTQDAATQRALAYFAEGLAFWRQGQYPKSLERFNAALELKPDDTPTKYYLELARQKVVAGSDTMRRGRLGS
ncbi:MAG: CHASE2 domain-containing protein [Planctomycetes bacterium]|nr:CHASE2 domain-containing protein [Planctomycetota bacterium]